MAQTNQIQVLSEKAKAIRDYIENGETERAEKDILELINLVESKLIEIEKDVIKIDMMDGRIDLIDNNGNHEYLLFDDEENKEIDYWAFRRFWEKYIKEEFGEDLDIKTTVDSDEYEIYLIVSIYLNLNDKKKILLKSISIKIKNEYFYLVPRKLLIKFVNDFFDVILIKDKLNIII